MKQYILHSVSGLVAEGEMWWALRDYVEDDDPILYLRLAEYLAGKMARRRAQFEPPLASNIAISRRRRTVHLANANIRRGSMLSMILSMGLFFIILSVSNEKDLRPSLPGESGVDFPLLRGGRRFDFLFALC